MLNTIDSLYEIIQAISTLDLEKCLANIVHSASIIVGAPFAAVFIYQSGSLELKSWVGAHVSPEDLFLITPGNIVKEVIKQRKLILIQDTDTVHNILPLLPNSRSVLAVPLEIDNKIIGVLLIESTRVNAFGNRAQKRLIRLATLAAIAISNADLFYQLEERNREILLINEMSSALQKCNGVREALEAAAQYGNRFFPFTEGVFFMPKYDAHPVEEVVSWGGLDEKEAKKIINSAKQKLCIPLKARDENIGILYLRKKKGANSNGLFLDDSQKRLITTFTDQISLALDNLKLREILTYQALRDSLTGLYNRRYMEESLKRKLSRAKRKKGTLSLMMLDIDFFKRVNDTYGHKAGDKVLIKLSRILNTHIRKGDIACRYGGEEFLIILPDVELPVAYDRGEKIRKVFKNCSFELGNQRLGPITVSIGIVAYPTHGETPHKLLMEADKALYKAKMTGRDRVVIGYAGNNFNCF